ncbi:MAG: amidohydrolase family protein [Planctomycetota bacterium]|nr:amidohydrolase family protein [Planctomycetota bacterium]
MTATVSILRAPLGVFGAAALWAAGAGTCMGAQEPVGDTSPGLALRAAKVLVCSSDGEQTVVDHGTVLSRDGRIEAVLPRDVEVPEGYELEDLGDSWLMPGMIDLHSHIAGRGYNDAVYQANPGLRVKCTVVPGNANLRRALAGGVTTILYIPGSATNLGGEGILLKTAPTSYEDMVVRDPGSLKVAQADNPKRWGYGMNRIMLNWTVREAFTRGVAYAKTWAAYEAGDWGKDEPAPEVNPQFEVFRALYSGAAQISTHTQVHQVVLASMNIMKGEFGLDVFIDHGTFDGYKATGRALELDVPAILGPRSINMQTKGRGIDTDGAIMGVAAEYQRRGMTDIGFNTDAPVVPAEELALQGAMGARFGFRDEAGEVVRGLTIVPAEVAGIDHRVGSLEAGKDADIVVLDGHPADPRSAVTRVYVNGELSYDAREERLF